MTPTELIAEARELCKKADDALWPTSGHGLDEPCISVAIYNDLPSSMHPALRSLVSRSNTLIPALCDALEALQSTLEQTWEWDMYKCARREIERLRKTLELVRIDRDTAYEEMNRLKAELSESQRWIPVTERLPHEADGMVLALVSGKPRKNITLHSAYMLAEHNAAEGWIVSEYPEWDNASVTHWMPLPQPPKGECE